MANKTHCDNPDCKKEFTSNAGVPRGQLFPAMRHEDPHGRPLQTFEVCYSREGAVCRAWAIAEVARVEAADRARYALPPTTPASDDPIVSDEPTNPNVKVERQTVIPGAVVPKPTPKK